MFSQSKKARSGSRDGRFSAALGVAPLLASLLAGCADHSSERPGGVAPVRVPRYWVRDELSIGARQSVDVVARDVDADGDIDLLVADLAGGMAVLLGDGTGAYTEGGSYPVSGAPLAIVARDLNDDGAVDVALVSAETNRATVFRNDGAGSFTQSQELDIEMLAVEVAVGDFTGDGRPDLLVAHLSRSDVLLFPGLGDATFGEPSSLTVPRGTRVAGLTVADINEDGEQDVLLCDTDANRVVVRFGPDLGPSGSVAMVDVGSTPVALSVGDIDGDGSPEAVVSNFGDETISVIGVDKGLYVEDSFDVSGRPARSTIDDANGDGFLDLAVCVLGRNSVSVFDGSATGLSRTETQFPSTGFPYRPLVADVAGDARPDLVVVPSGIDRINVYVQTDRGLRGARTVDTSVPTPEMITSADFDGDGRADVLAGGSESHGLALLERSPDGSTLVERFQLDVADAVVSLATADLDDDGLPEVLLAQAGGLRLLRNRSAPGQPSFELVPANRSIWLATGDQVASVVAADVTGDGILDLVATVLRGQEVLVLPGSSGGPFEFGAPVRNAVDGGPLGLAITDVDGDGDPEVAVSRTEVAAISILDPDSTGGLTSRIDLPVGAAPTYLRSADLDANGRDDLLVVCSAIDEVQALLSLTQGGFRTESFATGRRPGPLLVDDFDGDRRLDVLIMSLTRTDFRLVLGDGGGGARQTLVFPGVYGAASAVLADVAGTARPDLVVGSFETDRVTIFEDVSVPISAQ
ncbi:MAG: VCBS repeat-containing protein [Planctomycetes bacterium]|nr:VCBS repeat-containing protein [Planctomycetota bacterium]